MIETVMSYVCDLFNPVMLILFILMISLVVYEVKRREAGLKAEIEIREQQFAQIASDYKLFRSVIHDTNKHLKTIAGMIENQENALALEYIKETVNELNGSYIKVNTGNIVVDALVSSLMHQCNELDIKCTTNICIDNSYLSISNHDMTVILGNLIDNSINAVSKINNSEERYIEISLITDDTKFMIEVSNSYQEISEPTSKKGYGLGNIERTVHANKGEYSVMKNDGIYRTSIFIYHSIQKTDHSIQN